MAVNWSTIGRRKLVGKAGSVPRSRLVLDMGWSGSEVLQTKPQVRRKLKKSESIW